MEDEGFFFSKFRYINFSGAICHWANKSLELPLVINNHPPLPSGDEESIGFFLCLFPLNFLQLKTALMSK